MNEKNRVPVATVIDCALVPLYTPAEQAALPRVLSVHLAELMADYGPAAVLNAAAAALRADMAEAAELCGRHALAAAYANAAQRTTLSAIDIAATETGIHDHK